MANRVFGRNFYRGTCVKCGVRVGEREGYAGVIDGTNVVWCLIHQPTPEELNPSSGEAPSIYGDLSADGSTIEMTLKGHHPREAFDDVVAARKLG